MRRRQKNKLRRRHNNLLHHVHHLHRLRPCRRTATCAVRPAAITAAATRLRRERRARRTARQSVRPRHPVRPRLRVQHPRRPRRRRPQRDTRAVVRLVHLRPRQRQAHRAPHRLAVRHQHHRPPRRQHLQQRRVVPCQRLRPRLRVRHRLAGHGHRRELRAAPHRLQRVQGLLLHPARGELRCDAAAEHARAVHLRQGVVHDELARFGTAVRQLAVHLTRGLHAAEERRRHDYRRALLAGKTPQVLAALARLYAAGSGERRVVGAVRGLCVVLVDVVLPFAVAHDVHPLVGASGRRSAAAVVVVVAAAHGTLSVRHGRHRILRVCGLRPLHKVCGTLALAAGEDLTHWYQREGGRGRKRGGGGVSVGEGRRRWRSPLTSSSLSLSL
eukprot:Rhum_TRINITY_DN11996_c1_g1::Rhum_TRINITY_DN11996_c1_g1_i1::g.47736::m.47736